MGCFSSSKLSDIKYCTTGFSLVIDEYTTAIVEIIKDIRKNPQGSHPIRGITTMDRRVGLDDARDMWTYESIRLIGNSIFDHHIRSITEEAFRSNNQEILIKIIKSTERLSSETWDDLNNTLNSLLNIEFLKRGTHMILETGNKACELKLLDLFVKCIDSQYNIGFFWLKDGVESPVHDYSQTCQNYIKELLKKYLKSNKRSFLDDTIIISNIYRNVIGLITQRLIYRPRTVNITDFRDIEKIIQDVIKREIITHIGVHTYIENLMIPILLQIEISNGREKIENMANICLKLFIHPHDYVEDSLRIIVINNEIDIPRYSHRSEPQDWYNHIIKILNNIYKKSAKTNNFLYTSEMLSLYDELLTIWLKMENWTRVEELIDHLPEFNKSLRESKLDIFDKNPIQILAKVSFVLLKSRQRKLFTKCLSLLLKIAFSSKEDMIEIFRIFGTLGIYAHYWKKNAKKTQCIDYLLKIYNKNHELVKEFDDSSFSNMYQNIFRHSRLIALTLGIESTTEFRDSFLDSFIKEFNSKIKSE